ncbi:putative secreted protein with PEP-CTERM sorting signal [Sinobacterium caligoides]|uniref:Putative secreted protein with PEP-CTERM sorting signal n=1 Tax=Sinobacterium caligoides TaxID=933926 RepID=A0A3N2E1P0_9GAMM|nr:VPLPA-CTERM sorting domain-containing protein [Sinobacterium caligoides]ROS05579.1 putative secreted protein with PEP-CTERM sorting signal [Sinobacterium caligoides]
MTMNKILLILLTSLTAVNAGATVYLDNPGPPEEGDLVLKSTDQHTFSYIFEEDYSGIVNIGVSNEGDTGVISILDVFSIFDPSLHLNSDAEMDTSNYVNSNFENGTTGEIFGFEFNALAGEALEFDWVFSSFDYAVFNDFAFVEISGLDYQVLAEVSGSEVPVPGAAWLFGSALLGLVSLKRRKNS